MGDETAVKADLIFLAHNRIEFTRESLRQLAANTDWRLVHNFVKYVDLGPNGIDDGTQDLMLQFSPPHCTVFTRIGHFGGPVNIMNRYLAGFGETSEIFAKIDNDVIVPPGWLNHSLTTMAQHPEISFLGLEPPASRTRAPWRKAPVAAPEDLANGSNCHPLHWACYAPCEAIGGIGLMRPAAFRGREPMNQHSIYGGFTDWQIRNRDLVKGWILPPIELFLLDRLWFEPWKSLSIGYIAKGWQRPWTDYTADAAPLWQWWLDSQDCRG